MTVEQTAAAATVNAENPWPGLLAFRESDHAFFQGRSRETDELFRIVMRERLVVLFGLSGLGKSSLLQAGLFPRLRPQRLLPVYIRLDFSPGAPDLVSQVLATVRRDAAASRAESPAARAGETLWEYFHRDGNHLWNDRNRPLLPLLIFDQFEEVFTLGRLDAARASATERLIEQLADIAEGRPPTALKSYLDQHPGEAAAFDFGRHHYKLLLSIREDFLPDLESLRPRMPALALNRFRLRRMHGDAAFDVVSQAEHLIDADVARQVVRFVSADRASLPLADVEVEPALLSVVCRELNNKRLLQRQDRITAALLEGSQEEVLTGFYARSTADLPIEVTQFVEDRLLTVSGFRDSVALENALSLPGVELSHIDALVERRLLRREDRGGVQRLELTHDLLAGVVRASRDARRTRDEAERERLTLVRHQEAQQQALLAAQDQEKRDREKRELRQYRVAAVVVLLLLIAAIGAAVVARRAQRLAAQEAVRAREAEAQARTAGQRARDQQAIAEELRARAQQQESIAVTEARRAEAARVDADAAAVISSSRELSTAALLNVASNPELSLQLALASTDRAETQDSRDVLHRALYASRVRFTLPVIGKPSADPYRLNDEGFKVAIDGNGMHVQVLEPGGTLTGWDLTGASPRRTYELKVGDYSAAAFSPDRRFLAVAGALGGQITLWSLDTQRAVVELGKDDTGLREFHSVAFSPGGTLLAVARCAGPHRNLCDTGVLDVWDLGARRRVVEALPSIGGIARSIAWQSESALAVGGSGSATGTSSGEIAVWRTLMPDAKAERFPSEGKTMGRVTGLAFAGTGRDRALLYAQADASEVHLLYLDGGFPERQRSTSHSGGLRVLASTADGALFATAGADHTARLWTADETAVRVVLPGHTEEIQGLAISADGTRLITAGADAARVWNIGANGELGAWSEKPDSLLRDLSGDGRFMTVVRGAELLVVDLLSGRPRTVSGVVDPLHVAALSRDGSRLAFGRVTVITIDDTTGQRVAAPNTVDGFLLQLEISGNGRRLLMRTEGQPRVWDIPTGGYLKVPAEFNQLGGSVVKVAIDDDGQWVAVQGDTREDLFVWDIAANRVARMALGADSRAALAFSRDGRRLAGNAPDGKVLLWDTKSGRIERTLTGHAGATTAVAFSADGKRLATGGGDRMIRLWDTATGNETMSLSGPSEPAVKMAFGPDDRRLTVASNRGDAIVYALTLEDLIRVARSRVTRTLTPAECRQFLRGEGCTARTPSVVVTRPDR